MESSIDLTEREEYLVYTAVERALRMIPEVVGQLIIQKETDRKLMVQFYKDNPGLEAHRNVVGEIIQKAKEENSTMSLSEIIKMITPQIKARIGVISKLKVDTIEKPSDLIFKGDNGAI